MLSSVKNNKGFATLIMIIILTGLVLIITFSLTSIIITKTRIGNNLVLSAQSYYSAESGLEDGLLRVISDYNYVIGLNSFGLDGASVDLSVAQNGNETTIESFSDFSNHERKVKASLVITSDDIAFHYGVQVGPGGLIMGNGSKIDGNIYSDGSITNPGGGGAYITGDAFVATGMSLGNSWTTYNSDENFGDDDPVLDMAQSFVATFPPVSIVGGGGTGATAIANIAGGAVTSVSITSGGSGYMSSPTVLIGGGTGAITVANIGGGLVTSIDVTSGGSGYSSTGGSLSQVSFYIKKNGNIANRTIYIVDDNGVLPSANSSPLKTFNGGAPPSTVLDTGKISKDVFGWVDYSFPSSPSLLAGQKYWVIIDTSEFTKYFTLGRDLTLGNTNGVSKYSEKWDAASPVWNNDAGDFDFKVWIGGQSTLLDGISVGGNAHAHEIKASNVCGDAFYQVIDADSFTFVENPTSTKCNAIFTPLPGPALTPGTADPDAVDPAVEALPISDSNIADWKNDALAINPSLPVLICTQPVSITISGGVLNCDFTPANGITITLNGTLWVKGNITLGTGGTKVILGSGYGGNSGVIIADNPGFESTSGKIVTETNVVICGSQGLDGGDCAPSIGSYILMLSTYSGSGSTDYAVDVRNNTNGAIFYAHQGTAYIKNGANLKEVTAYRLELEPNANVTYESGLANASFTSGPGAGWRISDWNEFE